jgi:transposase
VKFKFKILVYVRRKRPDQWQNNTWLLHHDNAPAHAAIPTRRFLTDNNMTVVPHSPYSPDLAPSNFFLLPKLKMKLKGRRFQTVEEIQAESQASLDTLVENDFQECFKNWRPHWDRCQASEGNYFEGDAVQGKPFCVLSRHSGNLLTTLRKL